ncbi:bifunctional alpha/beta hydrolase/class I SAM-dependent methyltransferase [Bartonella sp. HY406]|uniref:bifunctional alpha/beta hydrolase/class I SAM-dependent methyltransferase n=1 Tax=Bartonella sp. HY406 TaxID=2979331 RepID=UPI0021C8AA6E|nr:bifunctional alpha/beta hydrolase/class I SAM-dependent methyltransferase [Bartonella sp. HY406]UXN02817.1 bifunctional alpha/beta hydrolase/class I SAM-dependent methyltransferase [Bartonella sp. HY406]
MALDDMLKRTVEKCEFTTFDGETIHYLAWPVKDKKPKGAIFLFHRGHEHSGRMAHLVDELELPDYNFYAWDARGHGNSTGKRGFAPDFATMIRDMDDFIRFTIKKENIAIEDVAIIAQSVGAVTASAWVHDYAPNIRAMILASPAFKVKLYVPFARTGIKVWQKIKGQFFVNSYVKAKFLSHDPTRIKSFDEDPLISRVIASNILLELYEVADRVVSDAGAIHVPTQLFISGADWVVHHKPQHIFYENLGSSIKERHVLDGFYHDTLGEKNRDMALIDMRRFIEERFSAPYQKADLTKSHLTGHTRCEADQLARPLGSFEPKGLYYAAYRANLVLGGVLSKGIGIGQKTGFDSGSTLDYVYEDLPRGKGILGRMVDKTFLNAIGWRGIRQRKIHIEQFIKQAMGDLSKEDKPIHMVDIAAGHGRYVLDSLKTLAIKPTSLLLRDYSDINIEAGRKAIKDRNFESFARFEKGDAFDEASLSSIEPRPNIAVVSGLYELFADNDLITKSLHGLAKAMDKDGYLIYTNQPYHPQLEMIARALTSHRQKNGEGQAWVMRRRSQAEMDQLVANAGFDKQAQLIDKWGIFTVSIAKRR